MKNKDDDIEEIELSVVHPYTLYKNIFKSSSIEDGYSTDIDESFIRKTQNLYNNINTCLKTKNKAHDAQLICIQLLESHIIQLCRLLGINYKYQEHMFSILLERPQSDKEAISISFSDEKQIKQMLWGLRDVLIELYVLIDRDSSVFRAGKSNGDYIPEYALYDEKLFDGILPISNEMRI